ncbi:MAG: hypothetical protein AAF502_01380 [Bacteroidota bacterium]
MNLQRKNPVFVAACLVLSCLIFLPGCKKYPNGPWFTLRGKEARVVNSWCYELVLRNGLDVTEGLPELSIVYSKSSIGFNDDGRFSTIIHYSDSINFPAERYDGNWAFINNEEEILLDYDAPTPMAGDSQIWVITKLREKELWAEEDFGSNLYEYRLFPSDSKETE